MATMWSTDVGAGAWIEERLSPFGNGKVSSVVPGGFPAYARLLHPAGAHDDGPGTRWAEAAAWAGTELTAQSGWTEVALPPTRPAAALPWDGTGPDEGRLPPAAATVLANLLAAHTSTPGRCWFGVWEGWADLSAKGAISVDLARLQLPQRAYLLYTGSVDAAAEVPGRPPVTPNLWWSEDRAWCIASEIDLDRTYVGGSVALIEALTVHPALEAQRVDPTDGQVHRSLPGWLWSAVDEAATRLVAENRTELDLSRGTVTAHLRRPTICSGGFLSTAPVGDHGSTGTSTRPLGRRDMPTVRRLAAEALECAAADLVR